MIRALVIIESSKLNEAKQMLQLHPFSYSAEESAEIFVPAGSPTGNRPATKHWLSGELAEEHWQACVQLAQALDWAECFSYSLESNPNFPHQKLSELGLKPLVSEI